MKTGVCAQCQEPTNKRCSGCLDAPNYQDDSCPPKFYCSHKCKLDDWPTHKELCDVLYGRKQLLRASQILRALFYTIRLYATPVQFESLHLEEADLFLFGFKTSNKSERALFPMPISVGDNQIAFDAALMLGGSKDALIYLYCFAKELLNGMFFFLRHRGLMH